MHFPHTLLMEDEGGKGEDWYGNRDFFNMWCEETKGLVQGYVMSGSGIARGVYAASQTSCCRFIAIVCMELVVSLWPWKVQHSQKVSKFVAAEIEREGGRELHSPHQPDNLPSVAKCFPRRSVRSPLVLGIALSPIHVIRSNPPWRPAVITVFY